MKTFYFNGGDCMFLGPAYVFKVVQDLCKLGAPFMVLATCTRSTSPKLFHGLTSQVGRSPFCLLFRIGAADRRSG